MISITLSSEISEACPDLHVLAIACQVKNTEPDERLWEEITRVEEDIRSTCKRILISGLLFSLPVRLINVWGKTRTGIALPPRR